MIGPARTRDLAWAGGCGLAFIVLAVAVSAQRTPLAGVDDTGRHLADWAAAHDPLSSALRVLETLTGTVWMTVWVTLIAGVLILRGQPRAGVYVALVSLVTALSTTALKLWIGRERPEWQHLAGMLESRSFPSGHSSAITALCGSLLVLVWMFVRRTNLRLLITAGLGLVALSVYADRILLGRHYPTDVVGGALLGAFVVLVARACFDPAPRSTAVGQEPLTASVPPGSRDLHVVLNPVKVDDPGKFEAVVTELALAAGWATPVMHLTTVEDPGTGMAEAAAVAGADLVIVCGGDGTVREVCAELAGTGVPVGIVPAGTGNLLARNLAIPLYLRSAIDVALNGQDRAVDLVEVSGDGFEPTHFMVMAGMGIDAAIMEGVNEDLKAKVGWVAYVVSGLRSMMFPALKVEVTVDDGEPTVHRARTVVVGNVGYLQAGMPLLPDAAIDDGQIDVVLLYPRRFLSWIPLALRVLSRGTRVDETVMRMSGRTITVRASSEAPRQLDGDSIGLGRDLVMTCQHGRVLVRVPR